MNKGNSPVLLTNVINPLFKKYAMDVKKIYADDSCVKCGVCVKICKYTNITMQSKPVWGKQCNQCLSCILYYN